MENKRLDEINAHLSLFQYKDGFSYGTDAVLLSAYTRVKRGARGAEIGTGTGIIPILLSYRRAHEKIFAFEAQEKYAVLARENIERNGYSDRVEVIGDRVQEYKKYGIENLDFVVTNPPYMKMNSGFLNKDEGKLAARHESAGDIFELLRAASGMLKNGGDFFVVYRPERMADLFAAMRGAAIEPKELVFVHSKIMQPPVLLLCRGQKERAPGMKVGAPLVLYGEDGEDSPQLKHIYEMGDFNFGK